MIRDELDETLGIANILASYDWQIAEWKARMNAVQRIRKTYESSSYAQKSLKKEEKMFKRKYWEAVNGLRKFKKEVGLV